MEIFLNINTRKEKLSNGSLLAVLQLSGHLDLGQPAIVFNEKIEELQKEKITYIILDLFEVKTCMADWLMITLEKLQEKGVEIAFIKVPDRVMQIFKFLGIDADLKIYRTEQEAMTALASLRKAR